LGVGLLAVSAAAAAVGLGFGVRAGELNAQSTAALRVGETATLFSQASASAVTANWFFAGGGVLAAVGTLLIVF
jgi:hypothetical protein